MMLRNLLERYPVLSSCREDLQKALIALISCFVQNGKLLVCGNGGSAADGDHITGELLKGFMKKRPLSEDLRKQMTARSPGLTAEMLSGLQKGLPAVSLPSATALVSAFCNDIDPAMVYAQGVMALGNPPDLLLAISTSGNAQNVYNAALVAKGLGLTVIALTGESGGRLKSVADISICVPQTETYKVQELHLPVYHYLCAAVEEHFFPE